MLPENREFWVRGDDGLEYGPVGLGELREWIQENRIGLETVVRADDPDSSWQHWQVHPELVALLAEAQSVPSNAAREGQVAGNLVKRIAAFGIDFFLSYLLTFPILLVLGFLFRPDLLVQITLASKDPAHHPAVTLSTPDEGIVMLLVCTMLTLYMAGFHALHGRTPGKSIMRLKVVDETGEKPALVPCLVRSMLLVVSLGLYGLPMVYAFFNPQRRAFHDFLAGTYVVER